MRFILLCLVAICACLEINAQSISGKVKDDQKQNIFFANVALYKSADSTLVQVVTTEENGSFILKSIKEGNYYLTASMLGYKDQSILDINFKNESIDKFNFSLDSEATTLSTIEVTGKAPLLEQQADKLIVNVADNITNTSGSLLDVMKKVPGMIVVNDRLSLAGAGAPTIYLNGKSTQYMDVQSLLKDMPGDNIQKVEIIHQPGAEYEAAGSGPIINIITKKNALLGTNGSVSAAVGRGELWDYNTGLNISHYQGKFNILAGIGYSRNAWVENLGLVRRIENKDPSLAGIYTQDNREEARPNTIRGNLRLDYDLTDKHRIGIETKGYSNGNKYIGTNVTNIELASEEFADYRLDTENDIDKSWNYVAVNPYYIFEIDTSGQKLEFDVNIANYNFESLNTLSTINNFDSDIEMQRYNQPGTNNILATALDYSKPIGEKFTIKFGAKYSKASLDNDLQSSFLNDADQWEDDVNQSNHYLFDETIFAGYGKLNWKLSAWSGTLGLRYEKSQSVGESLTLDSIQTREISKVFPSLSLSKKWGKKLESTVAYSYRIDRPRYSSLNPFVYYIDPFTYYQGNPNLSPELTHSAKFSLSYEGQPFFNVEYKQSKDAIVEVTLAEKEEAFKTDVNFEKQEIFSTSLFFPLSFIKGLDGYGGVIVTNNAYDSNFNNGSFLRSRWHTVAFLNAQFKLPWEMNAELGGWFTSGQQEGIFKTEYMYGSSFGVSKKLLDNKLKLSLGVEDFVNRFWFASVDYQQDMDVAVSWQAPVVNMRLSYKFGNQHMKSKGKRKGSASDEIRRAKQ